MGTWGVGTFDDDTANDVRDDFRDAIGEGLSGEAATERLIKRYVPTDAESGPVFWLALAATQWELGCLVDAVKAEALRIIADSADLARWADRSQDLTKRKAVLAELAKQLTSPPPAPAKVAKRFVQACDWQKGELVVYTTGSGTEVHLRVFDLQRDASGTAPVCELVDLAPGTKLEQATVADAPARHFKSDPLANPPSLRATRLGGASRSLFMLGARGPGEIPTARLKRTGIVTNPWHEPSRSVNVAGVQIAAPGFRVLRWRDLDASLKNLYGIE